MANLYWIEQTDGDVPAGNAWLSAAEAAFQEGLRFAKRRNDWRLGRWTAKLALAAHKNLPIHFSSLRTIELRPEPEGAPQAFVSDQLADVTISLSHRAGTALCAIAPSNVAMGCDLEEIPQQTPNFLRDYFTASEQGWIAEAREADHAWLMMLVWSAKESALKALRVGLRSDTRSVIVSAIETSAAATEFSADPINVDRWSPLRVTHDSGRAFLGWWKSNEKFIYTTVADPPLATPVRLR